MDRRNDKIDMSVSEAKALHIGLTLAGDTTTDIEDYMRIRDVAGALRRAINHPSCISLITDSTNQPRVIMRTGAEDDTPDRTGHRITMDDCTDTHYLIRRASDELTQAVVELPGVILPENQKAAGEILRFVVNELDD